MHTGVLAGLAELLAFLTARMAADAELMDQRLPSHSSKGFWRTRCHHSLITWLASIHHGGVTLPTDQRVDVFILYLCAGTICGADERVSQHISQRFHIPRPDVLSSGLL